MATSLGFAGNEVIQKVILLQQKNLICGLAYKNFPQSTYILGVSVASGDIFNFPLPDITTFFLTLKRKKHWQTKVWRSWNCKLVRDEMNPRN